MEIGTKVSFAPYVTSRRRGVRHEHSVLTDLDVPSLDRGPGGGRPAPGAGRRRRRLRPDVGRGGHTGDADDRQPGDREAGRRPAEPDDPAGEAGADPAALRRPGDRRRRQGRRRRRLQPGGPGEDQPPAARGGGAVAAAHPDPLRLRHDPRLPHRVPHPAGRRQLVRPARGVRRRPVRRPRDGGRRHQAGLQPHGRRLPRAPLGPDRRGERRGPVPRFGDGRGAGQGRPGPELRRPRQGRRQRQAPRRLRAARRRARLQHDRHVRAAVAQPVPAAVQGRDRRRRGHRDVLVQRDQRCAGLRQPARPRPRSSSRSGASTDSSRATTPRSTSCGPARRRRRTRARAGTASPPTARPPARWR